MNRLPLFCAMLVLVAAVLTACSPPPAGVHEVLRIGADGSYRLREVPVPAEQLAATLAQAHQRDPDLFVEIVASPDARIEASTRVVGWLKAQSIRFAFVDEAVMRPAPQAPSSALPKPAAP